MSGKRKKIGFALGAGGSRGLAHIGFLKAMEEAGIKADMVSGCSMGSVVGAAYASGLSINEMKHATNKLKFFDLFSFAGIPGGLIGTQKMRSLLVKHLGDIEFSDLKIPFACTATDMVTQSLVEMHRGKVVDAVVASSSIPTIFTPTIRGNQRLIDGGILERVPVKLVKKLGADVIIAVDVMGGKPVREKCPGAMAMLLDVIDLMDAQNTKRYREENRSIINLWIEPDLGDMSQYTFKNLDFAYERGYAAGKAALPKIKEIIS